MLSTQVALITGASSGIGRATAVRLAHLGYHVFGTSRNPASIADVPDGVELLPLDVASDTSVAHCVNTIMERAGHIDLLVNNAGYALMGAIEETSLSEAQAIFETNFWGTVRMTQAVLPIMRRQEQGKVILMGVILGLIGQPFGAFLSSAKHALEGFAESLKYEVEPFGISVSILEPSFVATHADQAMHRIQKPLAVYIPQRDAVIAKFMHDLRVGMPPENVARTVERIVQARKPRLRYPVGNQTLLVAKAKHVFPEYIFARLARSAYGLSL